MQEIVRRNFGASLVSPLDIFLEHISVVKEIKTAVIIEESHQADTMTEEDFQTMTGEVDLLAMVVIKIEEEDHQVMEETEDHRGDTEMIGTDLQVGKETMTQREE